LTDRLPALIGSPEPHMRLAGLRALLDAAAVHRQSQFDQAMSEFQNSALPAMLRSGRKPISPWHDLPPKPATPAQQVPATPANDALNAISDFFGGAPASKAADQPATPSETKITTPTKSNSDAMTAIESLFGDLTKSNAYAAASKPATIDRPPDAARTTPSVAAASAAGDLPSQWMNRWQSGEASTRPEWLKACDGPTEALLTSGNAEERAAAMAAWLVLGHSERVADLLTAVAALQDAKHPSGDELAKNILSWLPAEARLAECQKRLAAYIKSNSTKLDNEEEPTLVGVMAAIQVAEQQIVAMLYEATLIDDEKMATWILELAAKPDIDDDFRSSLLTVLLRALVGPADSQFLSYLSSDEYTYDTKPPYLVLKTSRPADFPGRREACEWLREKYQHAADDRQRAIALLAVAKLDHLTAVNAAIGAAQATKSDGLLLHVALALLFSDTTPPVANRAAALLAHPAAAARAEAVWVLSMPPSGRISRRKLDTPFVYDHSDTLPGFSRIKDRFPADVLHRVIDNQNRDDKDSKSLTALVRLQLLSTGEATDLAQLEKDLHEPLTEYTKLSIAAALGKAGRTDDEALAWFEATYAELATASDEQKSAGLYEVLRGLDGERIIALRRKIRAKSGSGLFERLFGN
jgi:hypothetical protein